MPETNKETLQRIESLLDEMFSYADLSHPVLAELRRLAQERRVRGLEGGRGVVFKELEFFSGLNGERAQLDHAYKVLDPGDVLPQDIRLPSLPHIYGELMGVINDDSSSATDLAEVINKSTGLAATVLKLVNSPLYSPASKVETISRAVAMLGTDQLSLLASGTAVMSSFQDIPASLLDMTSFWRHSLGVGVLARVLGEAAGLREPERLFVAGLLHDVGRLILLTSSPDLVKEALVLSRERGMLLHYAEQEVVNYDHSAMGCVALRRWSIPESLAMAALFHHAPEIHENVQEVGVIHLADIMARALGMGLSGEYFVPPLKPAAWESLSLDSKDLESLSIKAEEQLEPMLEMLSTP